MSKLIKMFITTILISCGLNPLFAHGNHSKSPLVIKEITIQKIAIKKVATLVKSKKIHKSWLDSSIIDTEQKDFNEQEEWVVSFGNDQIENVEKKILYIFVTLEGEVTGANYSGL